MKRAALLFLLVLCLVISASGCATPAIGPWRGKVVEAGTMQPIEGAVVVAVWHKQSFGGPGGPNEGFLDAAETLTDKEGNFEIQPRRYLIIPLIRESSSRPDFTIYKPGYGYFPNERVAPKEAITQFFLNERTVVELPKWTDKKQRLKTLGYIRPPLVPDLYIPQLKNLINIERKNLGLRGFEQK
jgi:hypothetical protein